MWIAETEFSADKFPYLDNNNNHWVEFKAPQGKQGIPGKDGTNGHNGEDGHNGKDGKDGRDGRDGRDGHGRNR